MFRSWKGRVFGRRPFPLWQRVVLFFLAYVASAEASLLLSARGGTFVSFWLPAGLYVSVLLLNATRDWPWLSLGAFAANVVFDHFHGTKFFPTVGFYCANTVEAVLGAALVRRFVAEKPSLETLREVVGLLILSGVGGAMMGAVIGAGTLVHFGLSQSFEASWRTWWGSNAVAILLFAPFILTWFPKSGIKVNYVATWKKKAELAVVLAGLAGFMIYLLAWDRGIMSANRALATPLMLWAGLRFGPRIGTALSLLVALPIAFFTTQYSIGLTQEQATTGSYIFGLQIFLAMVNLVSLIPAIVLDERNRTMLSLRESENHFRGLTEAAFEGVSISEQGIILDMNDQGLKMFGYPRDEMIGKKIIELAAPESHDLVAEAVRTGQESIYGHKLLRKDGTFFYAEAQARMVTVGNRTLRMTALRDITERKRAEVLASSQRRVLEMIASGQPMPQTLDALLRMLETQSPDMMCSILLLEPDGVHLRHAAAPSLPAEFIRAVDGSAIGPCAGSCGTAAFRREPVFVADIANDPLWVDYQNLSLPPGLRACWSTPIFDAQQKVLGTFAIYHRTPGLPDERHRQLIEMAAHTAAICINKHMAEAEQLQAMAREQQARIQYTLQLIASQEAERKRIAAELHDSMGQNLLLIKNLAQMAARSPEPAQAYEHFININQLATQCIAEARQISRDLHPYQLDHLGLKRALEAMLENASRASDIRFAWKIDEVGELFSADAAMNLYRIVQESLNNIMKHSRARNVRVELERDIHDVLLRIRDDGCGFVADRLIERQNGLGLKNITERTRMLGGKLKVESAPGQGACIEVTVPVAAEAA